MKSYLKTIALVLSLLGCSLLHAQTNTGSTQSGQKDAAGAEVVSGPRGFLSINYKGQRFVIPFRAIVSLSRHEYIIDGGGKVHELTVDTSGSAIARYYYLDSLLENSPFNAAQIINNRMKKMEGMVEKRTGEDARTVIKHYPNTTHAKTIEFNLSSYDQLERIYDHIYDDWVRKNGRGDGRTLKIE